MQRSHYNDMNSSGCIIRSLDSEMLREVRGLQLMEEALARHDSVAHLFSQGKLAYSSNSFFFGGFQDNLQGSPNYSNL